MAITESVKNISARCNNCGANITRDINYFQLTFQKVTVPCKRCRQSVLTLNAEDGENVNISVPCPACGEVHSFKRKISNFFNTDEDIFSFVCPLSSLGIFFSGDKEKTGKALAKSRRELDRMIYEFQSENDMTEDDLCFEHERQMRDMIEQFVYDCANRNAIVCRCKDMKCTDSLQMEKLKDGVKLICKHCERSVTLTLQNGELLESFAKSNTIIIDD